MSTDEDGSVDGEPSIDCVQVGRTDVTSIVSKMVVEIFDVSWIRGEVVRGD